MIDDLEFSCNDITNPKQTRSEIESRTLGNAKAYIKTHIETKRIKLVLKKKDGTYRPEKRSECQTGDYSYFNVISDVIDIRSELLGAVQAAFNKNKDNKPDLEQETTNNINSNVKMNFCRIILTKKKQVKTTAYENGNDDEGQPIDDGISFSATQQTSSSGSKNNGNDISEEAQSHVENVDDMDGLNFSATQQTSSSEGHNNQPGSKQVFRKDLRLI